MPARLVVRAWFEHRNFQLWRRRRIPSGAYGQALYAIHANEVRCIASCESDIAVSGQRLCTN